MLGKKSIGQTPGKEPQLLSKRRKKNQEPNRPEILKNVGRNFKGSGVTEYERLGS